MFDRPLFEVMLSSTFRDLVVHRAHVDKVLKQHRLHAIQMEDDASLSDEDMIDASLAKVDAAGAYICLIGKRYGQIRHCPTRNPHELSLTELEFERAVDRGIPISVLSMGEDYLVVDRDNEFDPLKREKLQAFRERVGLPHRVVAQFQSWEQFLELVPVAVRDLRDTLEKRANKVAPSLALPMSAVAMADDILPTAPPNFHVVKPFAQGHKFVGRERELNRIGTWAMGPEPLLLFEAIGGMGKSMVTYRWMDQFACETRQDWAGRLWYSFYEEGASMNDFCVHALAYCEGRPPRDFRGIATAELEPLLLQHLQNKPYLIVMDGLERALAVYNRYDRAQMRDEDVATDPDDPMADPFRCIRPDDDHLLRSLATVRQSKMLVSTRNMPTALLNSSGRPIAGVDHVRLTGLAPPDAEQMLREAGVSGDSRRIREYLDTHFKCHPLMVGVVAGLVNSYLPAPGAFGRWLADPRGADSIDLAKLKGLEMKRTHILQVAYEALDADERYLLGTLAFFSQSVPGEVLVELNPRRPPRPKEVSFPEEVNESLDAEIQWLSRRYDTAPKSTNAEFGRHLAKRKAELEDRLEAKLKAYKEYRAALSSWQSSPETRAADAWLGRAVQGLQQRGLVISDMLTAQYDLHPMVRGFVRQALKSDESARMGTVVADFAQARLEPKYQSATSLADLAQGIQIVTALTLGGHFEQAASSLIHTGLNGVLGRLELHVDRLALLQPFFLQGWGALPDRVLSGEMKRDLASAAAFSLWGLERYLEAGTLFNLTIISAIADERLLSASWYINGLAFVTGRLGQVFRRFRLLELHGRIAKLLDAKEEIVDNKLRQGWLDLDRGQITDARIHLAWIEETSRDPANKNWIDELSLMNFRLCIEKKEGKAKQEDIIEMLSLAKEKSVGFGIRMAWWHLADYFQSVGDHRAAIQAFEESIALSRHSQIPEEELEASYAISLLATGRASEAGEIVSRIQAPNAKLAKYYLAAGNLAKARETALEGIQRAWSDGPPYAMHWDLQDYREVLAAVGEPEPPLPPFDATKKELFEFEADLLRLIAKVDSAKLAEA